MKFIYSQIKYMLCVALVFGATYNMSAQCPAGQKQVCVTYGAGSFDSENSWMLWDATNGTDILCSAPDPAAGTVNACVANGTQVEVYTWDSFGDSWNAATITVEVCETGANNGCPDPPMTILDAFTPPSGQGEDIDACPGGTTTNGDLQASFVIFCTADCMECPADLTVSTDPGVCSADLSLDLPGNPGGCPLDGVPITCGDVAGPAATLNMNATGLVNTDFTIPGVAPITAPCVISVPVTVLMIADIGGAGFEQTNIIGEDGTILGQNATSAGDCNPMGGTSVLNIPVDLWNTYAGDGTVTLTIVTDSDIDNICVTQTIQATAEICTEFERIPMTSA